MFQSYLWVTGTTDMAQNHCKSLAREIIKASELTNPTVLEIGSNDGTLLSALLAAGASSVIGVDPAANLQPKHLQGDIQLYQGFFSSKLAEQISHDISSVDVVVARNILSHVPDLNDVMTGIENVISDDGIVVIEFHEASKILTELHYESIYHEHTFYHSIRSMTVALSQIGYSLFDISRSPISGGSYVIYASKKERHQSLALVSALKDEISLGVYEKSKWIEFGKLSKLNIQKLREILTLESKSKWAAFGASARSSTLLNAIGKPSLAISAIADNNPLKQGKFSPGLHIPILKASKAINEETDRILICAFNFENEIVEFLRNDLHWQGEVILPLPRDVRRYRI
jgi:SAM-dependent methyltransferase